MANAPGPPGFWAGPRIWWPRSATRERSSHGLTGGCGRNADGVPSSGRRAVSAGGAGVWISGGFWGMFRAPTQSWRSRFWRVWRECSGWGRGPAAPGARASMRRCAMQRGRRRNVPAPAGMQHRLNRCGRQTGLWPRAASQYPGRSCMPVVWMQRQTWRRPCRTTLMERRPGLCARTRRRWRWNMPVLHCKWPAR